MHYTAARLVLALAILFVSTAVQGDDAPNPLVELDIVAAHYGIEFVLNPTFPIESVYGQIDGYSADEATLLLSAQLFAYEFTIYPEQLIKRTQLKRVVFCVELSLNDVPCGGLADCAQDVIYLNVSGAAQQKHHQRRTLHHEFFHIVDNCDDGSLLDVSWERINTDGFQYGKDHRAVMSLFSIIGLTGRTPGVPSQYSMTAVREDKAEVFSMLMVDPTCINTRVSKDAVLAAKVKRMRELLAAFCPEMNADYWVKLNQERQRGK